MQLETKNQKDIGEVTSKLTHEVRHMKRIIRWYELTDAEWERLQPYLPERQMGDKGRPRREPREMLNGIFWIARSGSGLARPAGAIRPVADGVQAVQGVVGKRADREVFP